MTVQSKLLKSALLSGFAVGSGAIGVGLEKLRAGPVLHQIHDQITEQMTSISDLKQELSGKIHIPIDSSLGPVPAFIKREIAEDFAEQVNAEVTKKLSATTQPTRMPPSSLEDYAYPTLARSYNLK